MSGNEALAWRPMGPGDAGDWAGLLNAISAADRDWEYLTEQDLLEDFSDPYLDFARGSVAVYHEGTMAGGEPLGVVISHEYEAYNKAVGGRDLYVALVGTRRAGPNRGIASALLVRALTGARAAGFASASLGVDADSLTGALGLYQRAGFTVELTSVTNTKPLLAAQPEGTPLAGH